MNHEINNKYCNTERSVERCGVRQSGGARMWMIKANNSNDTIELVITSIIT